MKKIITSLLMVLWVSNVLGQESHKIIFQLTSADSMVHKALLKQFHNILSVEPETEIEVVCHGPGIEMLMSNRTIVGKGITDLSKKGVLFKACDFTLKEKKISKTEIVQEAGYVEAGILAIVKRQSQGWYYIKAGF